MKTGNKPVSRHDNCMSNYFVSDKVHTVHTNVGNGLRAVPFNIVSSWCPQICNACNCRRFPRLRLHLYIHSAIIVTKEALAPWHAPR